MSRAFYVYIMASRSGTLYVGVTSNLARRVHEHKHGLVPGFTSKYRVSRLVYCEGTDDVGAALDREKQLKRWSRQKKMALVESVNPDWEDIGLEKADKSRLAARDPSTSVGMTKTADQDDIPQAKPNQEIRRSDSQRVQTPGGGGFSDCGAEAPDLVLSVISTILSVISTGAERSRAVRRDSLPAIGGRMSKTFYVYIMASRSWTLYVGVTSKLARRVHEHKHGLVPGFTSKYRVSRLVYCEHTDDVGAAIDREKQLKRWSRQKKMALVESVNPDWEDLSLEKADKSRLAARDPSTSVGMTKTADQDDIPQAKPNRGSKKE